MSLEKTFYLIEITKAAWAVFLFPFKVIGWAICIPLRILAALIG